MIPQRMCIGCRKLYPKNELVRIVRSSEGQCGIDASGKYKGRGAYICTKESCLNMAHKRKTLSRALRCRIETDVCQKIYEDLYKICEHDG